jgi:rhodanese-related sulfurtransferase
MKGENSKNYQIVDVREPNELEISKLPKDFTVINLPLQSVESWLPKVMEGELLDKTKQIICLCKHGRRGGIVSELLGKNSCVCLILF